MFKYDIYRDLATHDLVINVRLSEREIYEAEKMMNPTERGLLNLGGQRTAANRFMWLAIVAHVLENRAIIKAIQDKTQKEERSFDPMYKGASAASKREHRLTDYDEPGWEAWVHDDGRLYYWPVEEKDEKT